MDDTTLQIITGIGILVGAVIAIFLIIRVLMSYILTRVLSVAASVASLVIGFSLMSLSGSGWDISEGLTLQIIAAVLTFLGWMLFVGPSLFDVEWDGDVWVDINIFGQVDVTPSEDSTFMINLFVSLPIVLIGYFLLAPMQDFGILFVLLPIIPLAATVIGFLAGRFVER